MLATIATFVVFYSEVAKKRVTSYANISEWYRPRVADEITSIVRNI